MNRPTFLDPVTLKEIYGISRRGQTYFGRGIYVGVIGLIVYQFWTSIASRGPILSPSEYAELGRTLFTRFVPLQMVMVSIASIGAAADRIIREERAGTLGLLLLTPLTARLIAFSKWKAALAQSGSLILCGLPVLAVCVYLGSVGTWDLLWCFSLTAAMAMLGAAFGLRASAVYATVPRALVMGLLYLLGYALLPLALLFVAGLYGIYAAPFLHPAYSAGWMLTDRVVSVPALGYSWIPATILSFFAARVIVGNVAALIERKVKVPPAPLLPSDSEELVHPAATPKLFSKDAAPQRASREVWERDPLLWKEILTRAGGRWSRDSKSMFLIYAFIFILLCWLFTRGGSLGTFAFLSALFTILAVVNGASLFAPEKEGRKMEMLLSSPVSSADIVRSKLLAGLIAPESLRISLLGLVTAVGFSWWSGAGVLLYPAVFFLFLLFAFALAATASLHAATMQGAALACAGILCLILLVMPIAVSISLPPQGESLPPLVFLLSTLNPVWILEPLSADGGKGPGEAFGRFLLFSAFYLAATGGLVGVMLWRFDRIMGRA
jgi:ABC-type transport system involved in multi-copper enzyme maturation permease subunit